MPSTKNTTAQTPGYPLTCSVMAKPTKDNQTPGYPLTCSVMKKPAANGQTPGYPLTCTVITWLSISLSGYKLEEDGDDSARRGFNWLD
ncbi:pheromone precursor 2 [Fusarium pseudoanthophilum]|uniref:Pheromone 2 n=1 Tax=Fusarium pseudoanthophilum TaxID=48495 RepID=A0A8H5P0D2_9HYPO|nr:pheromone precursor 2 [Fusarium pseudoanthophilum]